MKGPKLQRGFFYGPSDGELAGCLVIVAAFFIGLGVLLSWLVPLAWHWLKPILHGWTA